MDRRDLLKLITLATCSVFVGEEFLLSGCKPNDKHSQGIRFSEKDISFLDEVGETILPATAKSPGAKITHIGKFMSVFVNDCYDEENQMIFHRGIIQLNEASQERFSNGFTDISQQQRHELLLNIDKLAKEYRKDGRPHYFTLMKQLTLYGFFTSEVGATQALRHVPVPARYDGALPYKYGDRAWAE